MPAQATVRPPTWAQRQRSMSARLYRGTNDSPSPSVQPLRMLTRPPQRRDAPRRDSLKRQRDARNFLALDVDFHLRDRATRPPRSGRSAGNWPAAGPIWRAAARSRSRGLRSRRCPRKPDSRAAASSRKLVIELGERLSRPTNTVASAASSRRFRYGDIGG